MAAGPQARLWRVALNVPAYRAETAEAALADHLGDTLQSIGRFVEGCAGRWRLEALVDAPPDAAAVTSALTQNPGGGPVRNLEIERLPETDWVARSLSTHAPVRAARFSVYGSHIDPPPPGQIKLCIDAGLAFGTGIHPSTRGCLLAIDRLARCRRFAAPLDIGCGSGLLALAMARAFQAPVLATDSDPIAVAEARLNARRNGLAGLVGIVRADGLRHQHIRDGGPFDLVTTNIFANTLVRLAPHVAAAASQGAAIVLSGLLQRQSAAVAAAYRVHAFVLRTHYDLGEWRTLVLSRAGVSV